MASKISGVGAILGVFGMLASAACDGVEAADVPADGEIAHRSIIDNATVLNSAAINGWSMNGWSMNGWSMNGWSMNGWSMNGWSMNGVVLSGSTFTGTVQVDGQPVTVNGTGFIGSQVVLGRGGVQYTLRFDDIYKDPAKPNGDVYFHKVSVRDPNTNVWSSLCRDSLGNPAEAIALRNHWDPVTGARINDANAVTLACRGAVLAKCVEWGYRPWATVNDCKSGSCTQVSLADHHQACTRMARADYCGDGTPHTFNNTPIDIYDRLSTPIQAQATKDYENWALEAEWGPNGATCVGDELRLKMFDDLGINYDYPSCLDAIDDISNCGNFEKSRATRLGNRYCYKWTSDPVACEDD